MDCRQALRLLTSLTALFLAGTATASEADPIILGDISTLSGALHFPEAAAAARLVFDEVNADGGIHGRPIIYVVEDDKGDPALAKELARRLVDERKIVAFVGGASTIACGENASFYDERNIASLPGTGTEPVCFKSRNIAPPNGGFETESTLALYFASERLKPRKLCLVGNRHPWIPGNFLGAVHRWEKITGQNLLVVDQELDPDGAPEPIIAKLVAAGCDAVYAGVQAKLAGRLLESLAASQTVRIKIVMPAEAYSASIARAVGNRLNGTVFAVGPFEFLESNLPAIVKFRRDMEKAGEPLTQFAIGGQIVARAIVDRLRSMEGPVTKETLLAALRQGSGHSTDGLTDVPYVFGPGAEHNPNQSVRIVELRDGKWMAADDGWIRLPEAKGQCAGDRPACAESVNGLGED